MSIDPRLMERRKTVAEDNAKRNVTRLLKFLAFVVVVGSLAWLAFSPWLSVNQVRTSGIEASDTHSVLVDQRVVAGTPMILISTPRVEESLLDDPWVAEATVRLHWPDEVTVDVVERTPAAWVQTAGGWTRRAVDGVALPSSAEPGEDLAWIDMPEISDEEAVESRDLLGALEFAESLPGDLQEGTVVTSFEGELWATVGEYQIRLGRATEMTEKAMSLDALLGEEIPEGSTLVLIAPTNPAVMTPDRATEGTETATEEEDGESGQQTEDESEESEEGDG
jgi:hypothetical protein